ncbi:MAG TPA: FctA domain-containing protein [Clostridiales bacterium]|nr:FctA domain-containing protein [Clostridiales bacterium]
MDVLSIIKNCKKLAVCFVLIGVLVTVMPLTAVAASETASVTLRVEQVFNNDSKSTGISTAFPYELIPEKPDAPMPKGSLLGLYDFTMDGSSVTEVGPMIFTTPGQYNYTLKRSASAASEKGYTYDEQTYKITIYVTRSDHGFTSQVIAKKENGSKTNDIKFVNSYAPLASDLDLMMDPPVKKTVSGTPSKDAAFVFQLSADDPAYPMPAGSVNGIKRMTIVGSGEKEFGTWSYTKAGIYYYTISEVNTKESGYTYDTAVYTITDVVKAIDGQLTVSRTVTNSANKSVQSCIFINTYHSTAASLGPKTGDTMTDTPYSIALAISLFTAFLCICWLVLLGKRSEDG